jgi:protein SCO1/2
MRIGTRARWFHWTTLALFACAVPALAQIVTEPKAERLPPQLGNVSIEQRLNQQVPLSLAFRDESGKTVRLSQFFQPNRPVVLSLVYFSCPMLCSDVMESMAHALRQVNFDAGKQFEIVTVSFDPRDTPQRASAAKQKYLPMYGHPGAERGWHFLTGDQKSIAALANAVGFHYSWDARTQQFVHSAGIMILTPGGKVSQYYYGARYFPADLRLGLIEASQNQIGRLADQVVLYCYHWDPRTGRYGLIVSRVLKISGAVTLLILGSALIFLFRKYPTRPAAEETSGSPVTVSRRDLHDHLHEFASGGAGRRRR